MKEDGSFASPRSPECDHSEAFGICGRSLAYHTEAGGGITASMAATG